MIPNSQIALLQQTLQDMGFENVKYSKNNNARLYFNQKDREYMKFVVDFEYPDRVEFGYLLDNCTLTVYDNDKKRSEYEKKKNCDIGWRNAMTYFCEQRVADPDLATKYGLILDLSNDLN